MKISVAAQTAAPLPMRRFSGFYAADRYSSESWEIHI